MPIYQKIVEYYRKYGSKLRVKRELDVPMTAINKALRLYLTPEEIEQLSKRKSKKKPPSPGDPPIKPDG